MDRNHADRTEPAATDESDSTTVSRRRLLQTTVGGAGLAGATGSASASTFTGCDDWADAPAEYPEIDLTSGNPTARNVEDLEDGAEVVVFVHGWLGLETSTDQAHTLEETDHDARVVAASWEADKLNYWAAERATETAGQRLAS